MRLGSSILVKRDMEAISEMQWLFYFSFLLFFMSSSSILLSPHSLSFLHPSFLSFIQIYFCLFHPYYRMCFSKFLWAMNSFVKYYQSLYGVSTYFRPLMSLNERHIYSLYILIHVKQHNSGAAAYPHVIWFYLLSITQVIIYYVSSGWISVPTRQPSGPHSLGP